MPTNTIEKRREMGYKPAKTVYNLAFADHPGLEIKMRSTSLGKLQSIMETDRSDITRNTEAQKKFFQMIVDLIVSWNFEHPEVEAADAEFSSRCANCGTSEDEPMPVTIASMQCLDLEMIMEIVNAWGIAVMRVSMGKGMNSSVGGMNIREEAMKMLGEMQSLSQ